MAALWYTSLLCVTLLVSSSLSASLPETAKAPATAPASDSTPADSDSKSEPAKGEINFDPALVGVLDRPPFDPVVDPSLVDPSLIDPSLIDPSLIDPSLLKSLMVKSLVDQSLGDVFVEVDPRFGGHHDHDHRFDQSYTEERYDRVQPYRGPAGGYAGVFAGQRNGIFGGRHGLFGRRNNLGAVPSVINMMMGLGGKIVGDMGWLVHDVLQGVVGGIMNASHGLIGGVRATGPFGRHVGYGRPRPLFNPYDNTDDGFSLSAFRHRDD